MKYKKKSKILVYAILSMILLSMSLYVYYVGKDYFGIHKSEFLGNSESIISVLKKTEGKMPFSFAFISDTENNDDSIFLIKILLSESIDFMVFVGDFANDPRLSEHKLFMHTISRFNPSMPIFLVPGNHDIDIKNNGKTGGFTETNFKETYGPLNFNFVYNNCLFIFLNNVDQNNNESYEYLKNILSKRDKNIKQIFLFCHVPLKKILDKVTMKENQDSKLNEIIVKYKIDYVISGDYHKHFELNDIDGTKYIISGSGGAHYHGKTLFGRFKSGTKITVYDNCVTEELIVKKKYRFTDNSIKHFIYNNIMSCFDSKVWLFNGIIAALIINALFSLFCFIKVIQI